MSTERPTPDARWVCTLPKRFGYPQCSPSRPLPGHESCGWHVPFQPVRGDGPSQIPPNTLRVLADEVEAAGHVFAADAMRRLADGATVVRGDGPGIEELRAALDAFGNDGDRTMDTALAWDVIDAARRLAAALRPTPDIEQLAASVKNPWIVHDPVAEDWYAFPTETQAVECAQSIIDGYGGDVWPDEVDEIVVTQVRHIAVERVIARRDDVGEDEWAEITGGSDSHIWSHYHMTPAAAPPATSPERTWHDDGRPNSETFGCYDDNVCPSGAPHTWACRNDPRRGPYRPTPGAPTSPEPDGEWTCYVADQMGDPCTKGRAHTACTVRNGEVSARPTPEAPVGDDRTPDTPNQDRTVILRFLDAVADSADDPEHRRAAGTLLWQVQQRRLGPSSDLR